jgi:putative acetyltransferase
MKGPPDGPAPHVREERHADHQAVLRVHRDAFGREAEAALVERLRLESVPRISIIAESESLIVGHALFSEARLVSEVGETVIGALGPVAVVRQHRRRGVAASLIREGLSLCWRRGWPAVIVLGDPAYYGRFGFTRADTWSIRCSLDVPPEAFMVAFAADPVQGPATARYAAAFNDV